MCDKYNESCKQEELGCKGCVYENKEREVERKCGKE